MPVRVNPGARWVAGILVIFQRVPGQIRKTIVVPVSGPRSASILKLDRCPWGGATGWRRCGSEAMAGAEAAGGGGDDGPSRNPEEQKAQQMHRRIGGACGFRMHDLVERRAPQDAADEMTRADAFEWSNRLAETWMVEQRCGLFTTAQREEYQWHARQISRRIVRIVGAEELADLTLAGAPTPPPQLPLRLGGADLPAGRPARRAGLFGIFDPRAVAGQIVQRIDLRRYALIEVAAMVNLRCGHLSSRYNDELRDRRRAIRLRISENEHQRPDTVCNGTRDRRLFRQGRALRGARRASS